MVDRGQSNPHGRPQILWHVLNDVAQVFTEVQQWSAFKLIMLQIYPALSICGGAHDSWQQSYIWIADIDIKTSPVPVQGPVDNPI